METIIIRTKSKKQTEEVVKKLKNISGLKIETKRTWEELDKNLPDVQISDSDILKEVKAVRYGKAT